MIEDLSSLLCPNFYKIVPESTKDPDPIPDQLVFAHTVYPPPAPWIVKVLNYDPINPLKSTYEIKPYSKDDHSHMPIKELGLQAEENYYVYIGKERPLVVVKGIGSHWRDPLRAESVFACVAIFTFKPRHSPGFRAKTMGFGYPNFFYLPGRANGLTEESVGRFELTQPIVRRAMRRILRGKEQRPIALSGEAFALFVNHLGRFMVGKDLDAQVCLDIDRYRELVAEALRENESGHAPAGPK